MGYHVYYIMESVDSNTGEFYIANLLREAPIMIPFLPAHLRAPAPGQRASANYENWPKIFKPKLKSTFWDKK